VDDEKGRRLLLPLPGVFTVKWGVKGRGGLTIVSYKVLSANGAGMSGFREILNKSLEFALSVKASTGIFRDVKK